MADTFTKARRPLIPHARRSVGPGRFTPVPSRGKRTLAPLEVVLQHLVNEGDVGVATTLGLADLFGVAALLCADTNGGKGRNGVGEPSRRS